jgi:hypothetical protein
MRWSEIDDMGGLPDSESEDRLRALQKEHDKAERLKPDARVVDPFYELDEPDENDDEDPFRDQNDCSRFDPQAGR